MPAHEPDFRLDGYKAVNDKVAKAFFHRIDIQQSDFTVLAEHHTQDGEHSYYLMHDRAATWGTPGEPQIVALHLKRDTSARRFGFSHEVLPLSSMAQSWLIARGCPQETILVPEGVGTEPADQATRSLEARIRGDGDHFALLHSYTDDASNRPQTTVLLRAFDEQDPMPFRVLLEAVDPKTWTHTLRRLRDSRDCQAVVGGPLERRERTAAALPAQGSPQRCPCRPRCARAPCPASRAEALIALLLAHAGTRRSGSVTRLQVGRGGE